MGRFLFIRGGAVGDFILTMPAIHLVRQRLPGNEIEILGYPSIAELAVSCGIADRVRSIEHASLAPFFAPGSNLDDEMVDYLQSFDVVISYLYDPDGYFGGNLLRAGVETLFLGPYRMDQSEPFRHASRQLARPLEGLALYLEDLEVVFPYPTQCVALERQERSLRVALHPGSGSPSKNWSFESWIEVASCLYRDNPRMEFFIVSGEAEASVIDQFLLLFEKSGLPYRRLDSVPLPELAGILSGMDLFLGHDSGVSHLAASAGVPCVLLFGPTDPRVWAPPHRSVTVLQAPGGDLSRIRPLQVVKAVEGFELFTGLE